MARGCAPRPLLLLALLSWWTTPLQAEEEFRISNVQTHLEEGVYLLDADIRYTLSEKSIVAMKSGIPLTIELTITISRERNWWPDEEVAGLDQRYELYYHALNQRYLLLNRNSGAYYTYPGLGEMLAALGRVRNFPLLDGRLLQQESRYVVEMQTALDIEALPVPLRPIAYVTPAWRLSSDPLSFSLRP